MPPYGSCYFDDVKFHQATYTFDESVTSDFIPYVLPDFAVDYYTSFWGIWASSQTTYTRVINSKFDVEFYDNAPTPTLLGTKTIYNGNLAGKATWTEYSGAVQPGDVLPGTTQVKLKLSRTGSANVGESAPYKIPNHYYDYVTFGPDYPTPTVSSVNPDHDMATQPVTVDISGEYFRDNEGTPTARLEKGSEGNIIATSVSVTDNNSLTCDFDTTGAATGAWSVVVENSDGQSGTLTDGFNVYPVPEVTNINPIWGENNQVLNGVSITGSAFRNPTEGITVELQRGAETIVGSSVTWVSSGEVMVDFDLNGATAATDWDVSLKHNDDNKEGIFENAFDVQYPPPEVTGINPPSGYRGETLNDVSINGNYLRNTPTTVQLKRGGDTISCSDFKFVSVNEITIDISIPFGAEIALPDWDVYVLHNDTSKSDTLPEAFDIQEPPAPVVTGINPSSGESGGIVNNAIVSGNNFRAGFIEVKLEMNGQADIVGTDINYINKNSFRCDFNLAGTVVGEWDLKVIHTDDTKFGVCSEAFTVTPGGGTLTPKITSITPSGGENTGTIDITDLLGDKFDGGATVKLTKSGQPIIYGTNVNVISASKITCKFNLAGATTGAWNVMVENPGGKSDTLSGGFTIYPAGGLPAPRVDCVSPGHEQRGEEITVRGLDFDPNSSVKKVWFGSSTGEKVTAWDNDSITVTVPEVPEDQNNVSLSVENSLGRSNSVDFTIDDNWEDSRPEAERKEYPYVTYLAEGCSANTFETYVLVQNPNKNDARVKVDFICDGAEVPGPSLTLSGESRFTVNMGDYAVDSYATATEVSATELVTVEKVMYWNERNGGHGTISSSTPSKKWYLAEGSTGGEFSTFVYILNPSAEAATVNVTYITEDGYVEGPRLAIPSRTRQAVTVSDTVPDTWSVSTLVDSDVPVVAERSMYLNGTVTGHNSIGSTSPSENWYLAEGSTGGDFETWVLAMNPNEEEAQVWITYMTEFGEVKGPEFKLAPLQRRTFNVAETVPDTWSVSTSVRSDKNVVAERAMYWNNRNGAHDSIGVKMPENTWCVPEGCTGTGFETWVLVQNPKDTDTNVRFTYMTETGPIAGPEFILGAYSRKTINVADTVSDTWSVSSFVNATSPVIVERAVYWNDRVDGDDTISIPIVLE